MTQFYSDPTRAADAYAPPDCEVFLLEKGPRYQGGGPYTLDHCPNEDGTDCHTEECDDCPAPGFYYWYCFPGCMPESGPYGPYETVAAAIAACQQESE